MKCFRFIALFLIVSLHGNLKSPLTEAELRTFADLLWQRECGKSIQGLVSWNEGEAFPSLGIGHFIWYPANYKGPYQETFPELIIFLQQHKVPIPAWLLKASKTGCPWPDRAIFMADRSDKINELRTLLADTRQLQAQFVLQRFVPVRQKLADVAPVNDRTDILKQFDRMAQTSKGLFAMIDYVHFKGEGVGTTERYQGRGWGLLQVLSQMHGERADDALAEFITQAKQVLQRRVDLSPKGRGELRWLKGWWARVEGYY